MNIKSNEFQKDHKYLGTQMGEQFVPETEDVLFQCFQTSKG